MLKGKKEPWPFIGASQNQDLEKSLSPINEIIKSPKKNNLGKSVGSLKNKIPMIAVPNAPIPVQTA